MREQENPYCAPRRSKETSNEDAALRKWLRRRDVTLPLAVRHALVDRFRTKEIWEHYRGFNKGLEEGKRLGRNSTIAEWERWTTAGRLARIERVLEKIKYSADDLEGAITDSAKHVGKAMRGELSTIHDQVLRHKHEPSELGIPGY